MGGADKSGINPAHLITRVVELLSILPGFTQKWGDMHQIKRPHRFSGEALTCL
ncbi:hypothetical protein X474_04615 [Dethiosulfatarculus sandiegensis]|uniref:Uncharacterized protein n=1 Tax=Dethiosulfatarculus sandiegensis TaxID=1429043 RepID=A0A0D2K0C1_9BACT|nr:hypothetical protein X474_04615 [Dethiosulfatarculus sandiegensis]